MFTAEDFLASRESRTTDLMNIFLVLNLSIGLGLFVLTDNRASAQEEHTSSVAVPAPPPAPGTPTQIRTTPCEHVEIWSESDLNLNPNEILLLCGDKNNPSWEHIPFFQMQGVAKSALERRGYLQPEFSVTDGKITIRAGTVVKITEIQVIGTNFDRVLEKYWLPLGKPLTPAMLDQITAHIEGVLGEEGYPCPTIDIKADRATGFVLVKVTEGEQWLVKKIVTEGIAGTNGRIEQRFLALGEGDIYDAIKLQLSSQRLIASGLVLDARFTARCNLREPGIVQLDMTTGDPRLLSFGFGFDTENYVMSRVLWENSRFGAMGSRAVFEAMLSYRSARVSAGFDWYYLPFVSRHYLANNLTLSQRNERQFRTLELKGLVAPSWQQDFSRSNLSWYAGPAFHIIRMERGPGRELSRLISADAGFRMMSHDFEYFRPSPRSGHQVSYNIMQAMKFVGSDVNITKHHFSTTHLWNVGAMQPPIYVLGLRTDFATVVTGQGTDSSEIPASLRLFLGGMDNIRGFGRNRLPGSEVGTLTTAYIGTELRFNEILPWRLQPLIFADFAMLGDDERNLVLNKDNIYWSPGFGTRWESPIGNMRFSLGHGFVEGPADDNLSHQEQWQFYFSFGDTF